jgi:hypothetical protein
MSGLPMLVFNKHHRQSLLLANALLGMKQTGMVVYFVSGLTTPAARSFGIYLVWTSIRSELVVEADADRFVCPPSSDRRSSHGIGKEWHSEAR